MYQLEGQMSDLKQKLEEIDIVNRPSNDVTQLLTFSQVKEVRTSEPVDDTEKPLLHNLLYAAHCTNSLLSSTPYQNELEVSNCIKRVFNQK